MKVRFKNLFLRDESVSTTIKPKTEIRLQFCKYKIDNKQHVLSVSCIYRHNNL